MDTKNGVLVRRDISLWDFLTLGFGPRTLLVTQVEPFKTKFLSAVTMNEMWDGDFGQDIDKVIEATIPLSLKEITFEKMMPTK